VVAVVNVATRLRLDHSHPVLAAALRAADPALQREAAAVAAAWVVAESSADDEAVVADGVRTLLHATGPVDFAAADVMMHASMLHSLHWQLDQAGDPDAQAVFRHALAASSLAHALGADECYFLEAVYEAIHGLDDPAPLIAEIEQRLAQAAP
jgi:hypothetical protein